MKRYGNIYAKIYDMDNLRLAHENARKDKLYYKEVKRTSNRRGESDCLQKKLLKKKGMILT